jgi:hypothetical protein
MIRHNRSVPPQLVIPSRIVRQISVIVVRSSPTARSLLLVTMVAVVMSANQTRS